MTRLRTAAAPAVQILAVLLLATLGAAPCARADDDPGGFTDLSWGFKGGLSIAQHQGTEAEGERPHFACIPAPPRSVECSPGSGASCAEPRARAQVPNGIRDRRRKGV